MSLLLRNWKTKEMINESYLESDYAEKSPDYFGGARLDFVNRLPQNRFAKILELGCGDGSTGALALTEGKCGTYVGIEMFAPVAEVARRRLTAVHVGNVDFVELPYADNFFDALILSEVVEHLVNPEATLARLLKLVKPGGFVMASSPNISHWRIIKRLVFGDFEYGNSGVMDRTHLRWFTPKSYRSLYESLGVFVEQVGSIEASKGHMNFLKKLLHSTSNHLFITQINLIGKK